MPFLNPLNYALLLESEPEEAEDGHTFNTFTNPLFLKYTIQAKPEQVEVEERTENSIRGNIVFDIKNTSNYPLFNYSSKTAHFLNGVKVRDVKIDAPYLAPSGGDNLRQSFKSNVSTVVNISGSCQYRIKGYVKGLGYNQKIDVRANVRVK